MSKEKLIIDAWIKLFSKYWPRKVSVDEIVKEAKIAKGTFYLYFKNKEELYKKIIDDYFSSWEEVIKEMVINISDIKQRLLKKMLLSLDFFENNEIMKNILFWNENYFFWKIDKEYIVNKHINLLILLFNNKENLDFDLISKIMWFYLNVINIKSQFKSKKEYNDFVLNFAWIIINGFFTDYKLLIEKNNLHL
jgi:AcrR family transcriptional regulator